jgi:hypothetical protein
MNKATFVRRISNDVAVQEPYRLEPPYEGYDFVVVSATVALYSGPETYIFGADSNGEILKWLELPGSYRGGLSHETALWNAGYAIGITK